MPRTPIEIPLIHVSTVCSLKSVTVADWLERILENTEGVVVFEDLPKYDKI